MEFNKQLSRIETGDSIEGFYVIKNIANKATASGSSYLSATISDKTGNIDLKVWNYPGPITPTDDGSVVKIRGTVESYRGTLQVVASKIRTAAEGDVYDPGALVPVAPIDANAAWVELLGFIDSISDQDYRNICQQMICKYGEKFRALPGGRVCITDS